MKLFRFRYFQYFIISKERKKYYFTKSVGKKSEFQPHKDALPSLKCGSSFWGDWTSDDVETMENDDRLYLAAQKRDHFLGDWDG